MARLPAPLATAAGAVVLVGWHLWPFPASLRDPGWACLAVVTALAAFFCLRTLTDIVAGFVAGGTGLPRYALLAFLLSAAVFGAISLSLAAPWSPMPAAWQQARESAPAALLWASALDALWTSLALALTRMLGASPPKEPAGTASR